MANVVLLHGSWLGGWIWDDVAPELTHHGHQVAAPTLSGDGGLNDHVAEVVAMVGDSTDVVLVAHSYSGMVATGVAAQIPEQIAHVIYLDAHVPTAGQSAFDVLPGIREAFEAGAAELGGGMVPPLPLAAFGITEPGDIAVIEPKLRPWPLKTHQEASPGLPRGVKTTYLQLAQGAFFGELAASLETLGWAVERIPLAHLAPITHAADITRELLRAM